MCSSSPSALPGAGPRRGDGPLGTRCWGHALRARARLGTLDAVSPAQRRGAQAGSPR